MKVPVLFFGQLAEQFGRSREVDIPAEGCTIADLRALLADEHPALNRPGIRAAIDQQVIGDDALARPGQEIAFFSPVSGG